MKKNKIPKEVEASNTQKEENQIRSQEASESLMNKLSQSKQFWESNVISLSKNYLINETEVEKKIAQLELERENHQLQIDQLNNELEALEEKDEKLKETSLEKIDAEISSLTENNKLLEERLRQLEQENSRLDQDLLPYTNIQLLNNKIDQWDFARLSHLMSILNMHIMSKQMNFASQPFNLETQNR